MFVLNLGIACSLHIEKTEDRTVLNFIVSFNKTVLNIIGMIMKPAPLGAGTLLAWVAGTMDIQVVGPFVKYLLVILPVCIINMIVQIFISAAIANGNPWAPTKKLVPMAILAGSQHSCSTLNTSPTMKPPQII